MSASIRLPCCLTAIILIACGGVPALAQKPARRPIAEEAPAYNDIVARSFLIDVEPLVEKYTGWDCEWPVPFRLVTRAQYVEAMAAEMKARLSKTDPELAKDEFLKPHFESKVAGLLGVYSSGSKSLYLLPGNLKPLLRALGVEQRHERALIEVIVANELTHAVQDARHRINERSLAMSDDESEAWTMIIEGHASWVADRVADELQLGEAAQRLGEKMATFSSPQRLHREQRSANVRGYTAGKKFIEAVYARGGLKAVQALFDHPPRSTEVIERPELFLAR